MARVTTLTWHCHAKRLLLGSGNRMAKREMPLDTKIIMSIRNWRYEYSVDAHPSILKYAHKPLNKIPHENTSAFQPDETTYLHTLFANELVRKKCSPHHTAESHTASQVKDLRALASISLELTIPSTF